MSQVSLLEWFSLFFKSINAGSAMYFIFTICGLLFFMWVYFKSSSRIKMKIRGMDRNVGGVFSFSHSIYLVAVCVVVLGLVFKIDDEVSYWVSALVFVFGTLVSYKSSQAAGFDGALSHFRDVVIGSVNIGLMSIKKLSDTPPEDIAAQATGSLYFLGVAGEKFIKKCMDDNEFFKRNNTQQNVRFLLMDPFSDDMKRLSGDLAKQKENRRKIIKTLEELSERSQMGYNFEVRLYPKVPPLRLMISDGRVTALSIYTSNDSGWKNSQLIFDSKNCPDSLAPYFTDLFNDLWERGLGINLNVRAEALKYLYEAPWSEAVDFGMVHGRFQGFHHEHLEYVLYGITHSKKCLIGITRPSNNEDNSCETLPHRGTAEGNPYSFEERKAMIVESLEVLGVPKERYDVIPFNVDCMEEAKLALDDLISSENSQCKNGVSSDKIVQFMKLFSSWEKNKRKIFEENGFEVRLIKNGPHDELLKNVTGTMVRELIAANRNWRDFVAPGTRRVLDAKPKEGK